MGFVVSRFSVPWPASRRTPLDHRIRSSGPSQTHPTWRAREPHWEVLRRGTLHHFGRAGLRTVRGASVASVAGRIGTGGRPGSLLVARTGRDAYCLAAAGAAGTEQP